MSKEQFSDDCPGCRPAVIDVKTGKVMGPETPMMQIVNGVWAKTTREQRQAFHNVCCNNSRQPEDLALAKEIFTAIQTAADAQSN